MSVSVGEVSGMIAAAVFALQFLLPLAFPAILVAFLSEENSLVTWSVLGRSLHSSFWPSILSTDTAAAAGVPRRVNTIGWLQILALVLVSVASIVTPLGLYDSIEPAKTQTNTSFSYVLDESAFGYGTPHRADAPFTRNCGPSVACPGSTLNQTCQKTGSLEKCTSEYDRKIPETLMDLFRDGAASFNTSVSSIFDIQWRTYKNATDPFGTARWYLQSAYRQLSLLILDGGVKPVEGLLVDMETGGIGFRNHTAPQPLLAYGSTWTEDVLFIQPETQCVSLNLTVDFTLPADDSSEPEGLRLTDRGGFSALPRTSPNFDTSPNGQHNLNLKERAFKAAWLNNFLTLVYFNATDPDWTNISRIGVGEGAAFPITAFSKSARFQVGQDIVRSNIEFGDYLNLTSYASRNQSQGSGNPFGITKRNFSMITNVCTGSSVSSLANINSSIIGCCLLYGAANRTDGGSRLVADPRSPWSIPIYSCATTIKATIWTVTFQYNGTGLEALKINATKPKTYKDRTSLPLWAVEDLQSSTLGNVQPLWGILGTSQFTNIPTSPYNISTLSQESLYLPGFLDQYSGLVNGGQPVPSTGQNLPGVDFYFQSLASALSINRPGGTGYQGYADYSGKTSGALYAKWQNLSTSADTAAKILDLVWTDVAANAVVGTKGWGLNAAASRQPNNIRIRASDGNDAQQNSVPITIYERHIRYQMLFAIPAFVTLAATVAVFLGVSVLAVMGRTGPGRIRKFLEATSAGRIIGAFLWINKSTGKGTREWIEAVGTRGVRITNEGISAEGENLMNETEEAD